MIKERKKGENEWESFCDAELNVLGRLMIISNTTGDPSLFHSISQSLLLLFKRITT